MNAPLRPHIFSLWLIIATYILPFFPVICWSYLQTEISATLSTDNELYSSPSSFIFIFPVKPLYWFYHATTLNLLNLSTALRSQLNMYITELHWTVTYRARRILYGYDSTYWNPWLVTQPCNIWILTYMTLSWRWSPCKPNKIFRAILEKSLSGVEDDALDYDKCDKWLSSLSVRWLNIVPMNSFYMPRKLHEWHNVVYHIAWQTTKIRRYIKV